MAQTSYDLVPYTSHSHPQTHIAHLYTIGRLLNLTPRQIGYALRKHDIPIKKF